MASVKPGTSSSSPRLLNRELSWLDFNARVLELAADPAVPLLERVRFCSIFSSNLDEFFMVRVAGLMGQVASGVVVRSPDGRTAQMALAEIRLRALELVATQSALWAEELCPALAAEGVRVGSVADCAKGELAELETRFEREIFPILTPLAVGPGQPFPYISGLSLSLGVFVRDPESGEERFARVKIPEGLPRFLGLGKRRLFVALEEVIGHFLDRLFPQMEVAERAVFRVTRDSDLELSGEADDLLEAVELELRRRRFGDAVRLEVSAAISGRMLERLKLGLGAGDDQVYQVEGALDLADAVQLAAIERPDLSWDVWQPTTQPRLALAVASEEIFAEVRRGDILAHHPYDSFATSFEAFVRAAAKDLKVIGIKTTVYRTSDESPLVPALIEAADRGKQSVCLVELKARFDERRNIEWSRSLERAGVHVVHGFPNLKIHAKATLVVRRDGDSLNRYVHIGTGNYHALNARLYEDFGLFTADEAIAADIADLFNYLTGFGRPLHFRKLLVAPFNLRARLIEEIRAVAATAASGEPARIRFKLNALTDEVLIEELYAASQAGAAVEIVARSVCMLRPGVSGLSERIRVRSVLGRFLEHSRFFSFQAGSQERTFLGSADLMPRNLDHRLEIVVPVEDRSLHQEIQAAFDLLIADSAGAWELGPDDRWQRVEPAGDGRAHSAQATLMRLARSRSRRRLVRRER